MVATVPVMVDSATEFGCIGVVSADRSRGGMELSVVLQRPATTETELRCLSMSVTPATTGASSGEPSPRFRDLIVAGGSSCQRETCGVYTFEVAGAGEGPVDAKVALEVIDDPTMTGVAELRFPVWLPPPPTPAISHHVEPPDSQRWNSRAWRPSNQDDRPAGELATGLPDLVVPLGAEVDLGDDVLTVLALERWGDRWRCGPTSAPTKADGGRQS